MAVRTRISPEVKLLTLREVDLEAVTIADGKTVKQLQQNRTTAKTAFTKQANYLSQTVGNMVQHVLQEEFNKLRFQGSAIQVRIT